MTGLAELLQDNTRLRARVAELEAELHSMRVAWSEREAEPEERRASRADEVEELRAELRRLHAEYQAKLERLQATYEEALALRDAKIEALQAHTEKLTRERERQRLSRRGRASERYIPDEQLLLFEGVEGPPPPPRAPVAEPPEDEEPGEEAHGEQPSSARARGRKRGKGRRGQPRRRRREDFAQLPSRTVHHRAEGATCPSCGGPLQKIGETRSFRLEWVPGHFEVLDIVRDKLACPHCASQGVLTVPGPYALDRSLAGNGLVARVLVDKFADHIPANRQAKRMQREGFEVGSHTLSGWIGQAAGLLERLAGAVQEQVLASPVLQGDDTGLPVQDGGDGRLRKGRLWAFTDQEQVFYAFTPSKAGAFPARLLEGYRGRLLLVDGGSEFNEVVRRQGLERAGCWSHLRRRFVEALPAHPVEAHLALGTIRDLFLIERELSDLDPPARRAARQERSRPLVEGFFNWIHALAPTVRPRSALGEALRYAIKQEETLRRFLEHGEFPLHNNLSELLLRQPVVGRKNWLFARSEGGARAAATLYTLVGSCALQGLDPWTYLRAVLDRIQAWPVNRLHELTPRSWRLTIEHSQRSSAA